MIDFLLQQEPGPDLIKLSGLQPVKNGMVLDYKRNRPIRLGPRRLIFLDSLRKDKFIRNWKSSIVQKVILYFCLIFDIFRYGFDFVFAKMETKLSSSPNKIFSAGYPFVFYSPVNFKSIKIFSEVMAKTF